MKKLLWLFLGGLFFSFAFSSCMSVKAYQKMYLNDVEMELSAKKIEMFETNYETYREGASGANGGKVGGGCGCN
ncbi:MAG: arginine decarboxylase [Porphyromonadaceae bacterium CG2_30_38_12]|nr:MAG: arginine decarboxylase [Porphyromonadaceae bacterium CG2_30_38_12]